jgi:DNA-binding HxlR family transcriptional regulator
VAKDTAGHAPELCSRFHRASELIGRRWTGAIIFVLLKSRCRFAALRAAIPDITDRMLSERLQELEQEGIVERTVVPDTPVRVEYTLTRKGTRAGVRDGCHRRVGAQMDSPRRAGGRRRYEAAEVAGRWRETEQSRVNLQKTNSQLPKCRGPANRWSGLLGVGS